MTVAPLPDWESFYVIVGSSAAALTGLMFVAVALVADNSPVREAEQGMGAFGTPTVTHLVAVLMVSAVLSAPWRSLVSVAWALAILGAVGLVYMVIVTRRAFGVTEYKPVFEDWAFHFILPYAAYTLMLVAGIVLPRSPDASLFTVAGGSLLIIFVAIHNAWDTVTYLALQAARRREKEKERK